MLHTGVDLIDISRVAQSLEGNRTAFLGRICRPSEIEIINSSRRADEKAAGIFALKEAFSKALGTGIGGELSFLDMEVSYSLKGQPQIKYVGEKFRYNSHDWEISCSVSHQANWLVAFVVIQGDLS